MPRKIPKKNQRRFVKLLDAYLTKSGRKRKELASACHWDASMVTKLMKLDTRPSLGTFHQFMVPFLVAHGGITHARQVIEMAELLDGELNERDLEALADAAGRQHDPLQSQFHFQERAERFRQTISEAWTRPEPEPVLSGAKRGSPPAPQVTTVEAETGAVSTPDTDSAEAQDESVPTPPTDAESVQGQEEATAASLAHWRSVLTTVVPSEPGEQLDPDELVAAVLDWESRLANPAIAGPVWDWLGDASRFDKLHQTWRLEFVLTSYDGATPWNRLEWEWLDALVLETARRYFRQEELSPRQLASFVADLGQIAFEAVKLNDGKAPSLVVNLNDVRPHLPIGQGANWDWLRRIAEAGPIRLSVLADDVCQFASREEAEFLAARYLLQEGSEDDFHRIVQNSGRPFGVLRQMVRALHFTGRDDSVQAFVEGLLGNSEVIPLRYLDAAELLAVSEGPSSKLLTPLWAQVEEALCQAWMEIDAPEYRAAIAKVLRELHSDRFKTTLWQALTAGPIWGRMWTAAVQGLATLGGAEVLEFLLATAEQPAPDEEPEHRPLSVVLSIARHLSATDTAALLTALALREGEYDEQWRAVLALDEIGTIPALRALQHIAQEARHPHLRRYAETRLRLLHNPYNPAKAAILARKLDAANPANDARVFHGLLQQAQAVLHRSVWVQRDEAGQDYAGPPSRTVSRALARVWANLEIDESFRVEASLSLVSARARPAFEICLGVLPLVDDADTYRAGRAEQLLVSLAPKTAAPWLWQLLGHALTPAQSAVIIRCLGRAGGMALGERFEAFLAHPAEPVAIAAVTALADSLGQAAGDRLWQIAEADPRSGVRKAAYEGLAVIGSEKAVPHLQEKLSSSDGHVDACLQLAELRHPDAERVLAHAARAATVKTRPGSHYLPALAKSGGAIAIQAIRDIAGPQPDEPALDDLRGQFADDTATRARDVWTRLVHHPSPAWRMTAAAVLVRDRAQALIEHVVRMALADRDPKVREFARGCLRWHAPSIGSEPATEDVLDRLEQQVLNSPVVDAYLLELLQKCFSGLARKGQSLPAGIVHRTLALFRPALSRAWATETTVSLLSVFAYPDFVAAAGEVTRLLEQAPLALGGQAAEARVRRQALETLVAMRAPGLLDRLVSLARSSQGPEIRERASDCLAEVADFRRLLELPSDLKPIFYRAAIRRDVRFLRERFRTRAILANAQWVWV